MLRPSPGRRRRAVAGRGRRPLPCTRWRCGVGRRRPRGVLRVGGIEAVAAIPGRAGRGRRSGAAVLPIARRDRPAAPGARSAPPTSVGDRRRGGGRGRRGVPAATSGQCVEVADRAAADRGAGADQRAGAAVSRGGVAVPAQVRCHPRAARRGSGGHAPSQHRGLGVRHQVRQVGSVTPVSAARNCSRPSAVLAVSEKPLLAVSQTWRVARWRTPAQTCVKPFSRAAGRGRRRRPPRSPGRRGAAMPSTRIALSPSESFSRPSVEPTSSPESSRTRSSR